VNFHLTPVPEPEVAALFLNIIFSLHYNRDWKHQLLGLQWPPLAISVMHRSGVRPSVCPIFFNVNRARGAYSHTQRDSPESSTRRGQRSRSIRRTGLLVSIITARRYASAAYAVGLVMSVCLSVCLSLRHNSVFDQNDQI